jgi:septal ring factor EnvC (AmiA/AmiB activator)
MSNTAFDFAGFQIQASSSKPSINLDSITEDFKSSQPKKSKGFTSLLNASISYFNQESQYPVSFPASDIDIYKEQLHKIKSSYQEIEQSNTKISEDCEKLRKNIEDGQKSKKSLENSILSLKKYTQQLENTNKAIASEIKIEHRKHEELQNAINQQIKFRYSPQNYNLEHLDKKIKKKTSDIEKPAPRPITYKPITQRGIRSSRENSKK